MSFDYRVQAGLYRQLDHAEKRLDQIGRNGQDTEETLAAMDAEKFRMLSSLSASATYTQFLSERAKVVLDGIQ